MIRRFRTLFQKLRRKSRLDRLGGGRFRSVVFSSDGDSDAGWNGDFESSTESDSDSANCDAGSVDWVTFVEAAFASENSDWVTETGSDSASASDSDSDGSIYWYTESYGGSTRSYAESNRHIGVSDTHLDSERYEELPEEFPPPYSPTHPPAYSITPDADRDDPDYETWEWLYNGNRRSISPAETAWCRTSRRSSVITCWTRAFIESN